MYKLQFKDSGKSVWLIGEELTIGQSSDCKIVIDGKGVADKHATFQIRGDKVLIAPEVGQQVRVNGAVAISGRELRVGDVLSFGAVGCEFILPSKPNNTGVQKQAKVALDSEVDPDSVWRIIGAANRAHNITGTVVVGRSPDCDLTFSYERLSRRHAQFHEVDGVLWITDLESANGTFVNGERLTGVERLKDGDKISFEKLKFVVKEPAKKAAAGAVDDDDVGKTVVGSAIDAGALKKAQAEMAEKKRLREEQQKQAARQKREAEQIKKAPEPETGGSNMMPIIIGVVVLAIAGVAAVLLL